ncbi:MAG: sigma-70 family RNA polymerase sigma factor [Lachnospiraceae bacterium]|nr:sigma-70 family RNA polymerase sigma factor [Lachnospiraceae bacterium]
MNEYINDELIQNTYLFCIKRISDSEAAKDLSQDILCAALAAIKSNIQINDFYSWYWRMARNKYADYVAYKKHPELPIDIAVNVASDFMTPVDSLIADEDISELNYALSRLTTLYREIVIRFYLKGQTVAQIAAEINCPVGTVKRRLFDAKQNIKERINNMNNIGKTAYAPADIDWFWGFNMGDAEKALKTEISRQAMVICAKEAKTLNEIADEIGVAPIYLKEIIDIMVKEKLLAKPSKDKYIANVCIFPRESYYKANLLANNLLLENNIPEKVCKAVIDIKDKIMVLDFYGKELGFDYLCWLFFISAGSLVGETARDIYCKQYAKKYPDEPERKYRLTMNYLKADETIDYSKYELTKCMSWSNLWQNFRNSKYGLVYYVNDYEYKPFPSDFNGTSIESNRDKWVDGNNIGLLIDLSKEPGKILNEFEEEMAANFIKYGLLTKIDTGLKVMLPIFDRQTSKKIDSLIKEAVEPIAVEIADLIGKRVEEVLLPHVRSDLMSNFIHWDMRMFFQPIGVIMYHGLHETNYLHRPENYDCSAAGLFIQTEKKFILN